MIFKYKSNYKFYKYVVSLKDFFFQLMYENIDYSLVFIILNIKKFNEFFILNSMNIKDKVNYNFLFRLYMLDTWLNYTYYDDLFLELDPFTKGRYNEKLNKWILRYFYGKAELHMFYTESIKNRFINKKGFLI